MTIEVGSQVSLVSLAPGPGHLGLQIGQGDHAILQPGQLRGSAWHDCRLQQIRSTRDL